MTSRKDASLKRNIIDKPIARHIKKKRERERTEIKSEMKEETLQLIPQKYKGS